MEENAMTVAMNFYEEKKVDEMLKEAEALGVPVTVIDTKDTETTFAIGDTWTAVIFQKPGKPIAVTIRPVVKK